MKAKEKRRLRGYKIADSRYIAAKRVAKREGIPLATWVEMFVILLGEGNVDLAVKDCVPVVNKPK